MAKVNIIAMDLSPYPADEATLMHKYDNILTILDNYKKKHDPCAELGKYRIFSFIPNQCAYTMFVREFISNFCYRTKDPVIIIFRSLFDIAPKPATAYNLLLFLLEKPNVKAVYFLDYNLEKDVSEYMKYLLYAFALKRQEHSRSRRTESLPAEMINYLRILRNDSDPVSVAEIANVIGTTSGALRGILHKNKINTYEIRGKSGRKLSSEEKEDLEQHMDNFRKEVWETVRIHSVYKPK